MNMMNLTLVPPVSLDAVDGVVGLLRVIADPAAAKARLDELVKITDTAREAVEAQAKASTDLGMKERAYRATFEQERAQHAADLASARSGFEQERDRQLTDLHQRQAEVDALRARLTEELTAAQKLRADLARRIDAVKALAE
jgi:hypothetical protein